MTEVAREPSPALADDDPKLTDTMVEEEKQLEEQGEAQYEKEKQARLEEITSYDDAVKTQRQKQLHALVDKTVFYSAFLQKRIQERQEEERKKLARAEKRAENKAAAQAARTDQGQPQRQTRTRGKGAKAEAPAAAPAPRRGRAAGKRKAKDEDEELEAAKKAKVEEEQPAKDAAPALAETETATVEFEDTFSRTINGQPVSDRQPHLLSGGVLRDYQLAGMEWMASLWENGLNGILGDEMGLGKTIQCISFICHLMGKSVAGPFLIVAPLSTIQNWVNEFHRFAPKVHVVLYHGTQQEREELRLKHHLNSGKGAAECVVVTSYEICMNDRKHLQHLSWKYIIVDEGHRLKNLNCRLIQELKQYRSTNRLLLTGTPLQNNLAELWSLLNFLLPEIFDDLQKFQAWFDFEDLGDKFLVMEEKDQILSKLHIILEPFLLRRLKSDVDYFIPPKRELVVHSQMTPYQRDLYKASIERNVEAFLESKDADSAPASPASVASDAPRARRKASAKCTVSYKEVSDREYFKRMEQQLDAGSMDSVSSEISNLGTNKPKRLTNIKMNNIIMQLRKIVNHPYLLDYPLTDDGQYRIDEELVTSCGKVMLLDRLLPALKERGHRVLIFSQMTQMLDILHDYCYLRNYKFCRLDGATAQVDRQAAITDFTQDEDNFIFLLSTRAGGLGINLTSADTVIIYDSDWNPQVDLQAMDRAHRIGQTKPVIVYRLVTQGSVEEKMHQRAQEKRRLEKLVVHKGKFKGATETAGGVVLGMEDIAALLTEKDGIEVCADAEAGISDAELEALLDRSDAAFASAADASHSGNEHGEDQIPKFEVIHDDAPLTPAPASA